MAIVNANYEFIMADAGTNGKVSDGGVLFNTDFWEHLEKNNFNIPPPSELPNTSETFPYVFVADDAFQLGEHFMKPYSRVVFTKDIQIFNYRLSRARRIVENAFGILVNRFAVLQNKIILSPEKATLITLTCCYLHNFLIKKKTNYIRNLSDDEIQKLGDEHNLIPLQRGKSKNASRSAKDIRDRFKNYFNSIGRVSWQDDRVNLKT